jgi:hypothetical protein
VFLRSASHHFITYVTTLPPISCSELLPAGVRAWLTWFNVTSKLKGRGQQWTLHPRNLLEIEDRNLTAAI